MEPKQRNDFQWFNQEFLQSDKNFELKFEKENLIHMCIFEYNSKEYIGTGSTKTSAKSDMIQQLGNEYKKVVCFTTNTDEIDSLIEKYDERIIKIYLFLPNTHSFDENNCDERINIKTTDHPEIQMAFELGKNMQNLNNYLILFGNFIEL